MDDLLFRRLITIINRHATSGLPVKATDIMYVHGTQEDFEDMIRQVEEEINFIISFPPNVDIGELTVNQFIGHILRQREEMSK
ncbi:hypothetical protein [Paenibacillus tyrfis]|uniref:hypothetical protein n=1 Tax=Paenibacillus tyrfis TaxID=1501230 RepID=UPI000B5941DD|nr:hypothetical protein [Paenibacillus tyrfis]